MQAGYLRDQSRPAFDVRSENKEKNKHEGSYSEY